jgi:hypothetical protein
MLVQRDGLSDARVHRAARAGGRRPGIRAVRELRQTMHTRRVGRLRQLGFDEGTANEISEQHTANFM